MEEKLHTHLISALDGGEWSVSRAGLFTSRVGSPNTYWIGGWMGFVTGLDVVAKREESCHYFCTPCNKIRRKVLTHVTVTSVFSGVCIYLNNFLPIYHQYKYQQYKLGYRAT